MFDLKAHSASSCCSYLYNRTQWYLQKVRGFKFIQNQDTARGSACEEGLNHWYRNKNTEGIDLGELKKECIVKAHEKFNQEALGVFESEPEFKNTINRIVPAAIDYFDNNYEGTPKLQQKINWSHQSLEKPFIGYLDFDFDTLVVDCKITAKTPSQLPQRYVIQGAIYKAATGKEVDFVYSIPLKDKVNVKPFTLTKAEAKEGLGLAIATARAIEKTIDALEFFTQDVLDAIFFPNPDAFYKPAEMAEAFKTFGIHRDQE